MANHVFMCYARSDQEFALQLAGNLKDRGVPVWLDQWDVPPGTDWDQTIDDALYGCAQMLIILSPTSIKSREVRGELRVALDEHKPIVPVLFKKCPIPRQLRVVNYVDFTSVQPDNSASLNSILRVLNVQQVKKNLKRSKAKKPTRRKKAEATPKTFINSIGMEFVLIPAGSFMMGSKLSAEEVAQAYVSIAKFHKNEHPQHKVTISKPFYLQTTPVTQEQWKKVMIGNQSHFEDCGDDCPVESIFWGDAKNFIKKLNKMEGADTYRLPTEAEWEYACRAGTTTEFSFGDDADMLGDYTWYDENSNERTHPVGQKEPNAWGLYDMHGNVWDWVEDDWHENYEGAPKDGRAWVDKPRSSDRVMRGSCYGDYAPNCRSAFRIGNSTAIHFNGIGFRVAIDL